MILCPSGPASTTNPVRASSQILANLAYSVFLDKDYYHDFTYYLNLKRFQNIDGDGAFNPLVVDDFDPTKADINYVFTDWAYNRLNTGPLYLYLVGFGAQDVYQITSGHILEASSLMYYLNSFQANVDRDVICLLEFTSSGSFCDDLITLSTTPYSRTIITCTILIFQTFLLN